MSFSGSQWRSVTVSCSFNYYKLIISIGLSAAGAKADFFEGRMREGQLREGRLRTLHDSILAFFRMFKIPSYSMTLKILKLHNYGQKKFRQCFTSICDGIIFYPNIT